MNCKGCFHLVTGFVEGDEIHDYCLKAKRMITTSMKCPGKKSLKVTT